MRWLAIAAVVFGVAALAYVLLRRRDDLVGGPKAASYAEIKRRIRSGEAPSPAPGLRSPPQAPPKPLDEIFGLKGAGFLPALADRVAAKADGASGGPLSPSEAALLDVLSLEAEVNNGGFDQYFFNSSGDRAREALAGLELVGARRAAGILLRAIDLFGPAGPSPSREARWSQMDRWTASERAALERLDAEFYRYPDPISDLLERHCRANRAAFGP